MMDLIYTWLAVSMYCIVGSLVLVNPKDLKKEEDKGDKVFENIFIFGFLPVINCIFALIVTTALFGRVIKFFKDCTEPKEK